MNFFPFPGNSRNDIVMYFPYQLLPFKMVILYPSVACGDVTHLSVKHSKGSGAMFNKECQLFLVFDQLRFHLFAFADISKGTIDVTWFTLRIVNQPRVKRYI